MKRHLVLVFALLLLAACGAPPTATPDFSATQIALAVAATMAAGGPTAPAVEAPTATLIPVASPPPTLSPPPPPPAPTHTLPPPPTATSPPASACPPPGNPAPPPRPASYEDIPSTLAAFLSAGGTAAQLESLLRDWGAITFDMGAVRSLDMTGDGSPETVVSLVDPTPGAQVGPFPPGDVLLFQCQAGSVTVAYQGRLAAEEDWSWFTFHLDKIEDVNYNSLHDLVYWWSTCGAHTCFDQLYVIEWDGAGWVNRVPDMEPYPYPTFIVGSGQILVDVVGFGSVGAGIQRGSREVWTWNVDRFSFSEEIWEPPLALIHHMHDGDAALAQGNYTAAIASYEAALNSPGLPNGLFPDDGPDSTAIVQAYARLKLIVAWVAAGDLITAEAHYNQLLADHTPGLPGYPYAFLGEAFWVNILASGDPWLACASVVAAAQADPTPAELLYAGYGNPEYEPDGLCALP
jgi:hypothetical protein